MKKRFITSLTIEKVRHLENINIPLMQDYARHLIFTGKNGSGKTSVLDAIAGFLGASATSNDPMEAEKLLKMDEANLAAALSNNPLKSDIQQIKERIISYKERISQAKHGIAITMNHPLEDLKTEYECGNFILAYFKADRVFHAEEPEHVEKVELKDHYAMTETPREDFVKYLLDLKMTEALAANGGKKEKAEKIKRWFDQFEGLLQRIFEDESLKLMFDEDTFTFSIHETGKEPFDFNTMSSGYAAILDIVVDIILQMEKQTDKRFAFDLPGIILIDELETHLHLALQKKIWDLLTTLFPNVQFIVSTHSPFILNTLDNVAIYDLENHVLVENGLTDIPYEGVVEGYFKVDALSDELKQKFDRFKTLVTKEELTDEDFGEIAKLKMYLDEIPDYLALDIATTYKNLKLAFEERDDIHD